MIVIYPPSDPGLPDSPGQADTAICLEYDILPVDTNNCARSGCHDAAGTKEGYVFNSYPTITHQKFVPGDPDETELYKVITEDDSDKHNRLSISRVSAAITAYMPVPPSNLKPIVAFASPSVPTGCQVL